MTADKSELSQSSKKLRSNPAVQFSEKQDPDDYLRKSLSPEELYESCEKLSVRLTLMAAFQIVVLIILAVAVFSFWFQSSEVFSWCILATFGIMLAVIHWTSVPLLDSAGELFSWIEHKFPARASYAARCNMLISRVKSFIALFKGTELLCLITFPISFPVIGIFAAFMFLSVFAIDGKTGEPWGVPGLFDGISAFFTLVSVFVLLTAVVLVVLHILCFFYLFVVRNELNNFRDLPAIKQNCISQPEKCETAPEVKNRKIQT